MMYERFTDRARKAMQLAHEEAQRLKHKRIGTEHILLGLMKEGRGVAAVVLRNAGIDDQRVRAEVERRTPASLEDSWRNNFPFTQDARQVIEHAIEEARQLGHNYVGTEHLLLGLLGEQEGIAAQGPWGSWFDA